MIALTSFRIQEFILGVMKDKTKKTVSLEEITVSNMYEIEAVIRVLEKKGLLTHEEVLEELKKIKEEQNKNNGKT
ncbi:MAG TPA: hypothetical protein VIL99_14280 [Ignavibacteria bacterium]